MEQSRDLDFDKLLENEVLKKAIIRSLEVIGEAAKKISDEFKNDHDRIQWRKIAGLRDKLIHHYFGVDWEVIWDIIRNNIPELDTDLRKLIDE